MKVVALTFLAAVAPVFGDSETGGSVSSFGAGVGAFAGRNQGPLLPGGTLNNFPQQNPNALAFANQGAQNIAGFSNRLQPTIRQTGPSLNALDDGFDTDTALNPNTGLPFDLSTRRAVGQLPTNIRANRFGLSSRDQLLRLNLIQNRQRALQGPIDPRNRLLSGARLGGIGNNLLGGRADGFIVGSPGVSTQPGLRRNFAGQGLLLDDDRAAFALNNIRTGRGGLQNINSMINAIGGLQAALRGIDSSNPLLNQLENRLSTLSLNDRQRALLSGLNPGSARQLSLVSQRGGPLLSPRAQALNGLRRNQVRLNQAALQRNLVDSLAGQTNDLDF